MNLNRNPTTEQLRELIRQGDDRAGDHVLWVTQAGEVRLSTIPRGHAAATLQEANPEMKVRFETFLAGNAYVGAEAAADDEWIAELFDRLLQGWQDARAKNGVSYLDQLGWTVNEPGW